MEAAGTAGLLHRLAMVLRSSSSAAPGTMCSRVLFSLLRCCPRPTKLPSSLGHPQTMSCKRPMAGSPDLSPPPPSKMGCMSAEAEGAGTGHGQTRDVTPLRTFTVRSARTSYCHAADVDPFFSVRHVTAPFRPGSSAGASRARPAALIAPHRGAEPSAEECQPQPPALLCTASAVLDALVRPAHTERG